MAKTFGEKVIDFNINLQYSGLLPDGFRVLNPYLENPETIYVMTQFYRKYYDDHHCRKLIIGINPSRHGAGVTGVPFRDTKRLKDVCGIEMNSAHTHEISSVFMYDMIRDFGGAEVFYKQFYINSPFPLAIIRKTTQGQYVNANYYDDKALYAMVKDFLIDSLRQHINLGTDPNECFVLGKRNAEFIRKLNREAQLFGNLKVLEHPRYIQQYKSKEKQFYIDKYILTLNNSSH